MKEIQAKYKSDPQLQQQKMAQLYQDNNVNPLAGCLPALVQIPIFISLYRALTNLAAQVYPFVLRLSVWPVRFGWVGGRVWSLLGCSPSAQPVSGRLEGARASPAWVVTLTRSPRTHTPQSAAQNELNEPFLWLPNLEGPTYGAGPTDGMNWLTKGWEGLTPSLGWHDTVAFLTIPLILIVSQSISQKILQPPGAKDDPVRA